MNIKHIRIEKEKLINKIYFFIKKMVINKRVILHLLLRVATFIF